MSDISKNVENLVGFSYTEWAVSVKYS